MNSASCKHCGRNLQPNSKFCGGCGSVNPIYKPNKPSDGFTPPNINTTPQRPTRPKTEIPVRIVEGPLFVLPKTLESEWKNLEQNIPFRQRGNVLFISNPSSGGDDVRRFLRENPQKTTSICIVGSDHEIEHDRLNNEFLLIIQGHSPYVYTDIYFGRSQGVPQPENCVRVIADETLIPVTRIPTTNIEIIKRLLAVNEDLPKTWRGGLIIQAEKFKVFSDNVADHIRKSEKPTFVVSPPHNYNTSGDAFKEKPSRVYCLVHGGDNNPQWFGHSIDTDRCSPAALDRKYVDVATNAIVISQACYGAVVDDESVSIAFRFLEQGAGAFVGSVNIAWGGGLHFLSSEHIPATVFSNLDAGLTLGQSLLECKKKIAQKALNTEEDISFATKNTLHSFVAYGSPWAKVQYSPRRGRPTELAKAPQIKEKYESPNVLDKYRRQVREGSLGSKYKGNLRARLPREIWGILDKRRVNLIQLKDNQRTYREIHDQIKDFIVNMKEEVETFTLSKNDQQYAFIAIHDTNQENLGLLLINEDGEIIQKLCKL